VLGRDVAAVEEETVQREQKREQEKAVFNDLCEVAGALGLTLIADLGVPVPFDRIPASAQELFRIKSPGSDE